MESHPGIACPGWLPCSAEQPSLAAWRHYSVGNIHGTELRQGKIGGLHSGRHACASDPHGATAPHQTVYEQALSGSAREGGYHRLCAVRCRVTRVCTSSYCALIPTQCRASALDHWVPPTPLNSTGTHRIVFELWRQPMDWHLQFKPLLHKDRTIPPRGQ